MALKLSVKIALCAALVLFAAASVLAVLADLGTLAGAESAGTADTAYELRAWEGRIALFSPPDGAEPVGLTDIRVTGLPITDRLALGSGIRAENYDEVVRLLEDFGS